MKVHPSTPGTARSTAATGQFQRVLQRAAAPPSRGTLQPAFLPARAPSSATSSGPALSTARSALASPENLGVARQAMHRESLRLGTVRTEAHADSYEKTEHRFTELLSRELAHELRATPPSELSMGPVPWSEPSSKAAPVQSISATVESWLSAGASSPVLGEAPSPQHKVQATLQLIEKIELFVQSQRPALRLSLGWPLPALVEVERTGPREVALRIQGRHGALAQEDLLRIRDAMGARGLRLHSLRAQ